uniref:Uncharacterized protein n=1 Tax=Romanomermis culicivorax TaxID=13658 RepID=A0A915KNB3_ROMCU
MIRSSVVGEFYHSINIDRKIINLAINFFYINTKDVGGILDFNDYAMSIVPEAYNVNGHNNSSRSLSDQSGTFWYYGSLACVLTVTDAAPGGIALCPHVRAEADSDSSHSRSLNKRDEENEDINEVVICENDDF